MSGCCYGCYIRHIAPVPNAMKLVLITVINLTALIAVACSSNGGQKVVAPPEQINCDSIDNFDRYRYNSVVTLEVPRPDDPAIVDEPYPPFKTIYDMDGAIQGNDRRQVVISYPETLGPDFHIRVIGDTVYEFIAGWEARPLDPTIPPIAYLPLDLCRSLEPEANLGSISSTPVEVNGFATRKFEFQVSPEFASRVWGPQSDMANFIPAFDVTLWVAEDGNWPVRADIRGRGQFDNGRKLRADLFWELRDINDKDIKIEPPLPAS